VTFGDTVAERDRLRRELRDLLLHLYAVVEGLIALEERATSLELERAMEPPDTPERVQ
jgi:hypothetical protein